MPRYHFHIHDGSNLRDDEGTELADPTQARIEAVRLAGVVIAEGAKTPKLGDDWELEVTNAAGLALFRFIFLVIAAPSVQI